MNRYLFLTICLSITLAAGKSIHSPSKVINVTPNNEENALEVTINYGTDVVRVRGKLGLSLPSAVGAWTACEEEVPGADCVQWGDFAKVILKAGSAPGCDRVEWTSTYARELEDCYDLDPNVHWYGGGEMNNQTWPISVNPRKETAYVTSDSMSKPETQFGGVLEPYWLLSNGAALFVDLDTPLFFSLNSRRENRVCFVAKDQDHFTKRSPLTLKYEWCTGANVKETHQLAINTFFELPSALPDERMLIEPLWTTWAQYHAEINQSIVIDYAKKLVEMGFQKSSHIEIDDNWESCYGEAAFHSDKFPDPKGMVEEIKKLNMRVTIWTHPFVNMECEIFREGVEKGYFMKNVKNEVGITSWWQGGQAGIIDATNPEAVEWWQTRLQRLLEETGVDSYKFDAGETNWLPAASAMAGDSKDWPNVYSTKYTEAVSIFGGLVEVRTAHRNQNLPIFFRILDKESLWSSENGLRAMIPSVFLFGIVGYPFVLPDMIGGNAYWGRPNKELYIRWMQMNIFMPQVQFSIVPWDFDDQTVQICLNVLAEREKYKEQILRAARQSVQDGTPVNRPLWWLDPTDSETFTIDDEYLLGDDILVAPVLEEGKTSRDIYLPVGVWTSEPDGTVYQGRQWLRDFPAPLEAIPFFRRTNWD